MVATLRVSACFRQNSELYTPFFLRQVIWYGVDKDENNGKLSHVGIKRIIIFKDANYEFYSAKFCHYQELSYRLSILSPLASLSSDDVASGSGRYGSN